MTFVTAQPEILRNAAAATPTVGVVPAAADDSYAATEAANAIAAS